MLPVNAFKRSFPKKFMQIEFNEVFKSFLVGNFWWWKEKFSFYFIVHIMKSLNSFIEFELEMGVEVVYY
jgi:hypothetical protein